MHLDLSNQTYYGSVGITGTLPDFSNAVYLTELNLRSNSLSGTIPSAFLSKLDTNAYIEVDLHSNKLEGSVPPDFSRFDRLAIYLSDNAISDVPYTLCQSQVEWMGWNVEEYGCDAILCPPQVFNDVGYQHSLASECQARPDSCTILWQHLM